MRQAVAVLALSGLAGVARAADTRPAAALSPTESNQAGGVENPFTISTIMQWVADHGLTILVILLGVVVLHRVVRVASEQIAVLLARGTTRGVEADRRKRVDTLVGVFRQVSTLVVYGGGLVMLLDEIGVPVTPVLGGAAVAGLAVAFGAQTLIRDFFMGMMLLVEEQYSVGDVVRIGGIAGRVERITLRTTMLRDQEGIAHFIPHGTITTVSNLTHTWSQIRFDIGVAYKENVDNVIEVLMDLAMGMRKDARWSDDIISDPEMLGVENFADSAVVIRFVMRTRPLRQWPVRREMLRRIKNRFDELGIEIPFPHRTVYHRNAIDSRGGLSAGSD